MAKGPLVTRSELRKHQKEAEKQTRKQEEIVRKTSEKEFRNEEKRIDNFYRKEAKKYKPVEKTRSGQNQQSRKMDRFLMKWIMIVAFLLIVVLIMVFFL